MVNITEYISTELKRTDYISTISSHFISVEYYRHGKMDVMIVGENNFSKSFDK